MTFFLVDRVRVELICHRSLDSIAPASATCDAVDFLMISIADGCPPSRI